MSDKLTRRRFAHDAGLFTLGGALVVSLAGDTANAAEADSEKRSDDDHEGACNFQASFMTWDFPYRKDPRPHARHNIPHGNMARIQLDAMVDVIYTASDKRQRYVLIAPCRTEWVYAENRLFQLPSREYRNIYSLSQQRDMGRAITCDGEKSRGTPVSDDFRSLKIDVVTFAKSRVLRTVAQIVKATAANAPLIGRTEITDPQGKWRYVLQYPIQTMNFQPKTNSFQVDTGPVLAPDFDAEVESPIDRLEMAHIAYNRLDRAEFIFRRPTGVSDKAGAPLCRVLHYSHVREDPARTQIFSGKDS